MSWEELELMAGAHNRLRAQEMLKQMVAARGDNDSWDQQRRLLLKIIRDA